MNACLVWFLPSSAERNSEGEDMGLLQLVNFMGGGSDLSASSSWGNKNTYTKFGIINWPSGRNLDLLCCLELC